MARIVVLGASGTGKSYYAGYLLEQGAPSFEFVVMMDLENEEVGLSASPNPLLRKLEVGSDELDSLDLLRVIYRNKKLRIVPTDLTMDETKELYGRLCRCAMVLGAEEKAGSVFVACDEAHNVVPQTNNLDERIERMITGGRKHGVECMHISQRPQTLHETALSQVDKAVYFRISGDNDIRKIQKSSEIDANRLKGLDKRQAIIENRNSGGSKLLNTNDIERQRPHYSGDDGLLDDVLPV